jgi:hypothetical protein
MNKTSVLAIAAAAALLSSPLYAQDSSSQPASSEPSSEVSSQPSSEPSSQASSEPSSMPSSEPSSASSEASSAVSSSQGGGGAGFSLDIDVSFSFSLTFEQAVEFKRLVIETNSAPVQVDSSVTISVGSTVPSTVVLTPLPVTILTLYPQLQGFLFFILPDGRIVIVNPTTLKIVLILTVD